MGWFLLPNIYYYMFFFFFSSRRRHTRCSRDWSSDVCSSDLEDFAQVDQVERQFPDGIPDRIAGHNEIVARQYFLALGQLELIEQQRRRGMRDRKSVV